MLHAATSYGGAGSVLDFSEARPEQRHGCYSYLEH